MSDVPPPRARRRQFLALFALGLVGVLSLPPVLARAIARAPIPAGAPRLPLGVLVALSLVQPALLVAAATWLGLRLAPRLGLRSHVAEAAGAGAPLWPRLRAEAPLAVGMGVAITALVALLDLAFSPFMGEAWRRFEDAADAPAGAVPMLVSGLLYGGVTEELMLRWGVLSLVAWLGWRLAGGLPGRHSGERAGRPQAGVMWAAILVSALLFGAGHLPAVRAFVPLTPVVVLRTVLLNALAGTAFGWLFWRRSLEAAMLAHASGHVVLFVLNLVARGGPAA